MDQVIDSVYTLHPAEDKDCFTEVVEKCEDVCDVCRDVVTETVEEVGYNYYHLFIQLWVGQKICHFTTNREPKMSQMSMLYCHIHNASSV